MNKIAVFRIFTKSLADLYSRVIHLKDTDPQLKVLLTVGGYSAGSADFEAISDSSVHRQLFADNAVSFLRQHGFDGLDVDWEYPSSSYKTHFTQLLQVITTRAVEYVHILHFTCLVFFVPLASTASNS